MCETEQGMLRQAQIQQATFHEDLHQIAAEEERQEQWWRNTFGERLQRDTGAYDQVLFGHAPLLALPVEAEPAPEVPVGRKERRRQRKELEKRQQAEYKALAGQQRLLTAGEAENLLVFQKEESREKWGKEKLPHSTLTREETLDRILNHQDYSNFENLDGVMRNLVASRALSTFVKNYGVRPGDDPEAVCERVRRSGVGVSALLDPALRLGLSLAQRTEGIDPEMQTFFRRLDEAMSTAVMAATLTHVADRGKVERYFKDKGSADAGGDAARAIEANKAQQIQIAKRLLLMQLSNFQKLLDGGGSESWDKSMAVALSHCSRVVLTLPREDGGASSAAEQKRMWNSILLTQGENKAQDNSRGSSTHSIERRKVAPGGAMVSKEKKLPFNFIGQRGMNCAIGGLGNAGVSGKTLCNDGSCGHFYSMHKEAGAGHYGAMLMGLESDANGVTNQMGHTHDIKATAEKASSLGGQRTDEVGKKYGGRQCDLTGMSARDIAEWMNALERVMLEWQGGGGPSDEDMNAAMRMISGGKMGERDWSVLHDLLRVPETVSHGPGAP